MVTGLTGNWVLGGAISGFITSTIMEIAEGECGSVINVLAGTGIGALMGGAGAHTGGILGTLLSGSIPGFVTAIVDLPRRVYKALFGN